MHRQEQDKVIRDKVERSTRLQNHRQINAVARNRRVRNFGTGVTLEDLDQRRGPVKPDQYDNQERDRNIQGAPAFRREDTAIEPEHCELGYADHDAVLYGCNVEPLVTLLAGLVWGFKTLRVVVHKRLIVLRLE
jgi:hypothetical protein